MSDDTDKHVATAPFGGLEPDVILGAIEQQGYLCNGRLLALNSYENRVYQVGVEDANPLIVKFYRPQRWTDEAIEEEHAFADELTALEIPVVAPLRNVDGASLLKFAGFRFSIYPYRRGVWPDLETAERRRQLGRFLARIHAVGATKQFLHRPAVDLQSLGVEAVDFLLQGSFLPPGTEHSYAEVTSDLLAQIARAFADTADEPRLRLHGDCHRSNILWTEDGPEFVDLDDCRTGPAIQDLWMLLDGEAEEMHQQFYELVEGYHVFFDLNWKQARLIEPLRALRMIYYSSWLARRWDDPAFPRSFPWFNSPSYWQGQIESLREQIERIERPPIVC